MLKNGDQLVPLAEILSEPCFSFLGNGSNVPRKKQLICH